MGCRLSLPAKGSIALCIWPQENDHSLSAAMSLMGGIGGDIFDFKNTMALIGDDTDTSDTGIVQHIHGTSVDVSVDHILLFVGQQK